MAEQTKEIEKHLKQILWSPKTESNGDQGKNKSSKSSSGGKHRHNQDKGERVTANEGPGESSRIGNEKTKTLAKNVPRTILQRNIDSKDSTTAEQSKASLDDDAILGQKEDIGQPIDREKNKQLQNSPSKTKKKQGKTDVNSEKKRKKKKKTKKQAKNKDEGEEKRDLHMSKVVRPEEDSKYTCQ